MRSFTQSSAGIPIGGNSPYPTLVPVSHNLAIAISHSQPSAPTQPDPPPVTYTPSLPTSPILSRNSFFNVSNNSNVVSPSARDHVNQAIRGCWAESTVKRYSGSIEQFIRFCDAERVPENLRFPADEFVLCAFAASSLRKHSGSTSRGRISALKAWHITQNLEWKGSLRLCYVLNGVHNLAPGKSKRPPRPPINARMLVQLVEKLDLNSALDAAVAACAVTAFWGQCRLGELLPTSSSPSLTSSLPTRADFRKSDRNPQSYNLHLPRTKTHIHGQNVVLVDQRAPINPLSLLKNHIHVNNMPASGFLFTYNVAGNSLPLTKSRFLQRCNTIWEQLGYPRATGHCFRIGGTTELLVAGTPPDVVKATGRWTSESFMRYWRSLDDIAPQHIRNLHKFSHRRKRQVTTTTGG